MSSIHGPRMRKLGKFFGVSDNEISDIYDNNNSNTSLQLLCDFIIFIFFDLF